MENNKPLTISQCLSDAGFSCRYIPIKEQPKLEAGIKAYAEQFHNESAKQENERLKQGIDDNRDRVEAMQKKARELLNSYETEGVSLQDLINLNNSLTPLWLSLNSLLPSPEQTPVNTGKEQEK